MKKMLFPALLSLFLVTSLMQPADARTVSVYNQTDTTIIISVFYVSSYCRADENVTIAPHGKFSVGAGICAVRNVFASMQDAKGVALQPRCTPYNGTGSNFYVTGKRRGYYAECKVT